MVDVLLIDDEVLVDVVQIVEVAMQVAKDECIGIHIGQYHRLVVENFGDIAAQHRNDIGHSVPAFVVHLLQGMEKGEITIFSVKCAINFDDSSETENSSE